MPKPLVQAAVPQATTDEVLFSSVAMIRQNLVADDV